MSRYLRPVDDFLQDPVIAGADEHGRSTSSVVNREAKAFPIGSAIIGTMPEVSYARYGKDNIRVCKVHRDKETGLQTVTEMTVRVLLEGDIEPSYTKADNSVVVATDTIKNTVFILVKQHPVQPPELFASTVAKHFVDQYNHIHVAHVKIVTHRWSRMMVDGQPHPHSFHRDSAETRNVEVTASSKNLLEIRSSIAGLLVLKSTGSQFNGFIRDEYTTLPETLDRILSTEVDATWTWRCFADVDDVREQSKRFDDAWENARTITMRTFAQDSSASVQATMYKMCDQILAADPQVEEVSYTLPNKHYFEIDLSWFKGLKNTGQDAEVYAPQSGPNGLIECTVRRKRNGVTHDRVYD